MSDIHEAMRMRAVHDRQRVGQGGGGKKKFSLLLRIGHSPVRVHLAGTKLYKDPMSGAELPYIVHEEHWVPRARGGKGSSFICGGDRCVICAYSNPQQFDLDLQVDTGLAKCARKTKYGVSGWIEEWHHNVQYERRDGQGVFHQRELHTGKSCEFCEWPRVFGRRFYIPFSYGTWHNDIENVNELASRQCKCGGLIYTTHYVCPACQEVTEDILNHCVCGASLEDGQLDIDLERGDVGCKVCGRAWHAYPFDEADIKKRVESAFTCRTCGAKDVLQQPVWQCTTEGCAGDRYSIFDCQLTLKKEGEGDKTKIIIDKWKIQEPDPMLFDPQYQGDDDWAKEHKDQLNLPLDITKYFLPDDPEFVAKQVGKPNPFAGQPMSRQVVRYQRPSQAEAAEGEEPAAEEEQQ